ncbi:hypothetical protein AAEX28_04125 [Lentisphaerota bacterium WC36G]|nr:hypothetical protein LJT99_06995 [Lentisphaerae bacterium WC36]
MSKFFWLKEICGQVERENKSISELKKQYQFNNSNLDSQFIKDKIQSEIYFYSDGEEILRTDLLNEYSQQKIEFCQSNAKSCSFYLTFIGYLFSYLNFCNLKRNIHTENWLKAIEIFKLLCFIEPSYPQQLIIYSEKEKHIVETLKYFKKYKLTVENGEIQATDKQVIQIATDLEKQLIALGAKFVFGNLLKEFCKPTNLNRYILPQSLKNEKFKPDLPINYLMQLCFKNWESKNNPKLDKTKSLNKIKKTAKYFLFIYDTQETSGFGAINGEYTPNEIYKKVLYNSAFKITQMDFNYLPLILNKLFRNIFTKNDEEKLGFSLDEYILFFTHPNFLPKEKYDKIKSNLCHKSTINDNFLLPTDINKTEIKNCFFSYPLIKESSGYKMVDKNLCAWNCYEALFSLFSKSSDKIGKNIESLLLYKLNNENIIKHYGDYQYGERGHNRECDIVLEEPNQIIFIEIKKKILTRKAIAGDGNQLFKDIINMFIHSQLQLLEHEKFIKFNKKIDFITGSNSTINFNDKKIVKVSVSLMDNFSLCDRAVSTNLVEYFSNIRFEDPEFTEYNIKLEKIQNLLSELYPTPEEYRDNRMNLLFIPLEFMLFAIDESIRKNCRIGEILQSILNVTSNTGDLWADYLDYSLNPKIKDITDYIRKNNQLYIKNY